MSEEWQHQVRIYLEESDGQAAPRDSGDPALAPLAEILRRHRATMVSQLDAFEAYVAEAERAGLEGFPLYRWTKATLEDPAKRRRHAASFALRIDGAEVYPQAPADALAAELQPLVDAGLVTRLSRHDTNPAGNLPVPPEYRA